MCTIGPSGSNLTLCSVVIRAASSKSEKNLCRLKASSSRATGVAGGSCIPPFPSKEFSPSSSCDRHPDIAATALFAKFDNSKSVRVVTFEHNLFVCISGPRAI